MQTPKTRAETLEVPQRSTKAARQLKTSGAELDNSSSQSPAANRTPKAKSPKVVNHRSPRTPTSEKKRFGRVSELETQLANLQEELKKTKDQLNKSESCKKRVHEDAEETKKQLAEMSEKFQDSEKQLDGISASEESRLQELMVSQDRDKAWESELEPVQKHHSMDSAALLSTMNEVQKLKNQLEKVAESEANQAKYAESAHNGMLTLRLELSKTLALVEELKTQLKDSKDSEARALKIASETRESCEKVAILEAKLEKSKTEFEDFKTKFLEKEAKLQKISEENNNLNEKIEKTELTTKKKKDTEDATKISKLEAHLDELKLVISEKKTELKNITEENERLKMEKNLVNDEAVVFAEAARIAEKVAVLKVGYLTEEAEKNGRKVLRVTEQLDLAQAANAEMEAELRRLKVHSDQWRKAAEAAAAMLSGNNNGKYVERTGSLDSHTIGGKLNSPFSEDESPKKKNGNMLKKIGILLKKSQK